MQMKPTKKNWLTPQIEEVTLDAEEDVLATCFTASQTDRSSGLGSPCVDFQGGNPCPTFP